ncbi:Uncharacterised protein [Acetobacterium wieringae]|uniref:hypothetical protein n=1 Tax=Acetobacterium wieringae TaxID=52694 RepID=UPI001D9A5FFB|nr:hypothetical protein [Acetobacterium wieringae]VUZ27662.1 Uncharacterised protein [Acetobacterium wieringae]
MDKRDLVLQLTLSAIENGLLGVDSQEYLENEDNESKNTFNAKEVSDFYNSIYSLLDC